QEKDSGILHNATAIRQQIQATAGETNEEPQPFPQFTVKGYADIYRMTGEHLIEGLHYAYDKYGMENTIVVCRSNKSANLYNQHIRNRINRKSTRLNSSHVKISYAVFCLKK